jgi:hypothetical protein
MHVSKSFQLGLPKHKHLVSDLEHVIVLKRQDT